MCVVTDDDALKLAVGDRLRVIRGQDEGLVLWVMKIRPDAIEVEDSGGRIGIILPTGFKSVERLPGGPPVWYNDLMESS